MKNCILIHHGIKGQKWGVRNGPPYPLDRGVSKKNSNDDVKSAIDERTRKFIESRKNDVLSRIAYGEKSDAIKKAVALTALLAATYGTFIYSGKKLGNYIERFTTVTLDEHYANRDIDSIKDAPRISKKMSTIENVRTINPDYPRKGTTANCVLCTVAMAFREKGYDVKATKSEYGVNSNVTCNKYFKSKYELLKLSPNQNSLDRLYKYGEGAYGNMTVDWKSVEGSHSVFWKNEGGKTHFYDAQCGKEIVNTKSFFSRVEPRVEYNRLDNCEPTEYALGAVRRNTK